MTRLTLHPEQAKHEEVSLSQQISRVTREHGSFALLNENALQDPQSRMEVDATPHETENILEEKSTLDLRRELSTKIGTALNEAALNLDFVSLLVSATRPQTGNASISPMLRSQVPNGSLNANTTVSPAPAIPAAAGYGWKIAKFQQSAKALQDAAERLKNEAKMEAKFWETLRKATSAGEVVNRKLQIKYGYHDSGSTYANLGVGKVEREPRSGEPVFKPHLSDALKLVQVSVFAEHTASFGPHSELNSETATPEPERKLGTSIVSCAFSFMPLDQFLRSVRQERAALFELELMQQLIHEARWDLGSQRVRICEGGKVVCDLVGCRIEIELVDPETAKPTNNAFSIAAAVNFSLHLLLVRQFRDRLRVRHEVPPPLVSNESEPGDGARKILRPVLAHIQHGILVSRVLKLVKVLLPRADVFLEKIAARGLDDVPQCTVWISAENDMKDELNANSARGKSISLRVRSPILNPKSPVVQVTKNGRTTDMFDLTELEVWLKWAAGE